MMARGGSAGEPSGQLPPERVGGRPAVEREVEQLVAVRGDAGRAERERHRDGERRDRGGPRGPAPPAAGQRQRHRHEEHILRLEACEAERHPGQHRPSPSHQPPVQSQEAHHRQAELAEVEAEHDRGGGEHGDEVGRALPGPGRRRQPPRDQEQQHQRRHPERQPGAERQAGEGDGQPGDRRQVGVGERSAVVRELAVEPAVVHRRPAVLEADPRRREVVVVVHPGLPAGEPLHQPAQAPDRVDADGHDRGRQRQGRQERRSGGRPSTLWMVATGPRAERPAGPLLAGARLAARRAPTPRAERGRRLAAVHPPTDEQQVPRDRDGPVTVAQTAAGRKSAGTVRSTRTATSQMVDRANTGVAHRPRTVPA